MRTSLSARRKMSRWHHDFELRMYPQCAAKCFLFSVQLQYISLFHLGLVCAWKSWQMLWTALPLGEERCGRNCLWKKITFSLTSLRKHFKPFNPNLSCHLSFLYIFYLHYNLRFIFLCLSCSFGSSKFCCHICSCGCITSNLYCSVPYALLVSTCHRHW